MKKRQAFTLIELLVVVSIIALLVSILLPALNKAREQAQRTVCASNINQTGKGLVMYATDNTGRFPLLGYVSMYLWNLTNDDLTNNKTADIIKEYTGAERDFFFCPSAKLFKQEPDLIDKYWDPSTYYGAIFKYRMTGYYWLLKRDPVTCPYIFSPLLNVENLTGPKDYVDKLSVRSPADKELVLDMVNSMVMGGDVNYEYLEGGGRKFPTNHYNVASGEPQGSNILFVDQHVSWRSFDDMEKRIRTTDAVEFTLWF